MRQYAVPAEYLCMFQEKWGECLSFLDSPNAAGSICGVSLTYDSRYCNWLRKSIGYCMNSLRATDVDTAVRELQERCSSLGVSVPVFDEQRWVEDFVTFVAQCKDATTEFRYSVVAQDLYWGGNNFEWPALVGLDDTKENLTGILVASACWVFHLSGVPTLDELSKALNMLVLNDTHWLELISRKFLSTDDEYTRVSLGIARDVWHGERNLNRFAELVEIGARSGPCAWPLLEKIR